MAKIEILAGPPGIGKSTNGMLYITEDIDILDHDFVAYQYRKKGFTDADAGAIANMKFNNAIKNYLLANEPFAIELNLGFQEHYDFVKNLKRFNNGNHGIDVKMLYTDDIDLCLERAKLRHQAGRHLVEPRVVMKKHFRY